jgi:predicted dehydrogenase
MTGVGLVGAGRFGRFVAEALAADPAIRVRAIADLEPAAARLLATRVRADIADSWAALGRRDDVDLVVVATPPDTHAEIAGAMLAAGRHVLCEKPLATTAADAAAVVRAAAAGPGVLAVDHVLRHNPLVDAVVSLQGGLLGQVRRFAVENDATDEPLSAGHWFWDEQVSGGIFVEHGVHFFDLGGFLVGQPARAVQAMAVPRPDGHTDLVHATVAHQGGALASYLHSFGHADRCQRQHLRLDCGTAEVRLEGWIPVAAVVDAWTDDAGVAAARELPARVGFDVDVQVHEGARPAPALSRRERLDLPHHVRIDLSLGGLPAKPRVYAASVRAAVDDLLAAAAQRRAPRAGADEGAAAVRLALAAQAAARDGTTVELADPAATT